MADISYPQLVHNIKEKYIEATGEPDNIKFGEIAQDIYDAITSGGGGNIGYQVTFKVDGNDYYIASCQQGESITEPPTPPIPEGYIALKSWQLDGTNISFPYTPNADVELTPLFQSLRTEMEVYGKDTVLIFSKGNPYCIKSYDGKGICGFQDSSSSSTSPYYMVVGETAAAVYFTENSNSGTFTYNGSTYHYCGCQKGSSFGITAIDNFVNVGGTYTGDKTSCATAILDYYYGVS